MCAGVGFIKGLQRIRINRRKAGLHGGQDRIHPHLKLVEVTFQRLGLVYRHAIRDENVRNGNSTELTSQTSCV